MVIFFLGLVDFWVGLDDLYISLIELGGYSQTFLDILSGALQTDVDKRPGPTQLLQFISNSKGLGSNSNWSNNSGWDISNSNVNFSPLIHGLV
jgi:hypothetical protein